MKTFVVPASELEVVGSERVILTRGVRGSPVAHQALLRFCCAGAGGGQNTWMGNRKTVANSKILPESLHGFPGQK